MRIKTIAVGSLIALGSSFGGLAYAAEDDRSAVENVTQKLFVSNSPMKTEASWGGGIGVRTLTLNFSKKPGDTEAGVIEACGGTIKNVKQDVHIENSPMKGNSIRTAVIKSGKDCNK